MKVFFLCAALMLLRPSAGASDEKKAQRPCTIKSQSSDKFFDLNPINVKLPEEGKKRASEKRTESYQARGYDYPANFTINFCGPVVEKIKDVDGIEESMWKNVSAFYEIDGQTYSLGFTNYEPVLRGRKLVMNYTDGSPCHSTVTPQNEPVDVHEIIDDDDDDEDKDGKDKEKGDKGKDDGGDKDKGKDEDKNKDKEGKKHNEPESGKRRRKSSIFSLLCENDPLATGATVSFVAVSDDECTYFFEARSHAACGGIEKESQQLGPGGVFSVILIIAVMAYLLGGCVYQRTVMHQRGWRQLPNYAVWAGIWSFVKDIIIILTSSCSRLLPRHRGYNRISLNGDRRSRGHHSEDENRLIDQLDEEWED